jgi:hypothetical protein
MIHPKFNRVVQLKKKYQEVMASVSSSLSALDTVTANSLTVKTTHNQPHRF